MRASFLLQEHLCVILMDEEMNSFSHWSEHGGGGGTLVFCVVWGSNQSSWLKENQTADETKPLCVIKDIKKDWRLLNEMESLEWIRIENTKRRERFESMTSVRRQEHRWWGGGREVGPLLKCIKGENRDDGKKEGAGTQQESLSALLHQRLLIKISLAVARGRRWCSMRVRPYVLWGEEGHSRKIPLLLSSCSALSPFHPQWLIAFFVSPCFPALWSLPGLQINLGWLS